MVKYIFAAIVLIAATQTKDRILVVGDSITQDGRFVSVLKDSFECARIGYVGESSTKILGHLIEKKLDEYDYLIIEAGINNFYNPDRVIEDLSIMAEYGKAANVKVVMLTLVPCRGYSKWIDQNLENHAKINKWIRSKPPNVDIVIDVYSLLADKDGYSKYATDSLHPNKQGHRIIGQAIMKGIKKGA